MLKNKLMRTVGAATLALMVSISAPEAKITISGLKQDLGMMDAHGKDQKYKAMDVVEKFEGLFKKAASQQDMSGLANLYTHFICTGKMRVLQNKPRDAAQNFVPPTQNILVSQTKTTDPQKIKIQNVFKAMFEGLKAHTIDVNKDTIAHTMNALKTEFASVAKHIDGAIALATQAYAEVFKDVVEEKKIEEPSEAQKKAAAAQIMAGLQKSITEKNSGTPTDNTGDKTTELFDNKKKDGNSDSLVTDEQSKKNETTTTPITEDKKPDISDVPLQKPVGAAPKNQTSLFNDAAKFLLAKSINTLTNSYAGDFVMGTGNTNGFFKTNG